MVVLAQRPCKTQERGLRRGYKRIHRDVMVTTETRIEKKMEQKVGLTRSKVLYF